MNPILFPKTKYSLILIFLLFSSCNKKWDPDKQFTEQSEKIRLEQQNYQAQLQQDAKQNLREFESKILLEVRKGISIQHFNKLVGFKYSILAHNSNIGKRWERRIYKWSDIVETKWNTYSMEYQLCEKNRDFFIITSNDEIVIAVEYL